MNNKPSGLIISILKVVYPLFKVVNQIRHKLIGLT